MQCNAMQCNAMQCNAMQCNAMQCSAMQCSGGEGRAVHLSDFRSSVGEEEEEEEEEGNPLHLRKSGTGQSEQKRQPDRGEGGGVAKGGGGDEVMEEEDVEELYDLASYSDGEDDPQEEGGQVDSKRHKSQLCRRVLKGSELRGRAIGCLAVAVCL